MASRTDSRRGLVRGEPVRFLQGHSLRLLAPYGSAEWAERFWSKVDKQDPERCWEWHGERDPGGYGRVVAHREGYGRVTYAHRIAYELLVGAIPDGLIIDHLCENPSCVNPAHLEPVLSWVNTQRGHSPAGLNARKTHCKHGHEFTPDNVYIDKRNGGRVCKKCARIATRRSRQK